MTTRPALHRLFASATLLTLCACQPPTPVAGTAPVASPTSSPNDRNAPVWNSNGASAADVSPPGVGVAASGYGQAAAIATNASGQNGQNGMTNPTRTAAAPSQNRFDQSTPVQAAGAGFGQVAQAPAPGTNAGQWQGGGLTHVQVPPSAADGRWQGDGATPVQATTGPANGQWQATGAPPVQGHPGAGQWQGATPAQLQAMTPQQQAAFLQRAEIERQRVHDDVIRQIRQDEVSEE